MELLVEVSTQNTDVNHWMLDCKYFYHYATNRMKSCYISFYKAKNSEYMCIDNIKKYFSGNLVVLNQEFSICL